MIQKVNEITSENPIEQIWKLLRFFLDIPSVSNTIRQIHAIPEGQYEADIKKQARQIGYCIRQAEEYFNASSQVGLPTRPLLLYYGAVSLSQALVLLRQDGTHSLDALRKNPKHKHHGLNPLWGTIRPSDGTEDFLKAIECSCNTQNGTLWGHFPLFYNSLVPCAVCLEREINDQGKKIVLHGNVPQNCADLLTLEYIASKRFNTLDLIKSLPDMYFVLQQLDIQPALCRGNVKVTIIRNFKKNKQGNEEVNKINQTIDFFIDGISPDQKAYLLTFYKEKNPNIELIDELGSNIYLQLRREQTPPEEVPISYLPDIVDDINGQKFYILRPDDYVPEPAAQLIILYCFGMLSRYYPDLWMGAIDDNVQIAEITDSLLNIIYRKFPNMVLDQMTWVKHYVHL